jgi:putative membrane protein
LTWIQGHACASGEVVVSAYAVRMKWLARWLLLAAALMLLAQFDAGVHVTGFGAALLAAFVIGLLNAFVRPLLILLTLPVTVLTLGLFLFVINAFTFQMASGMLEGFQVAGFWDALLGSVLYSLWGLVIDAALERIFPSRLPPGFPPMPPR